ncbi:hypothetical protein ISS37_06395 [candidate division KSB1 bacterium]|nr:hypothetical protein [candidate division KSB1 bacterium]
MNNDETNQPLSNGDKAFLSKIYESTWENVRGTEKSIIQYIIIIVTVIAIVAYSLYFNKSYLVFSYSNFPNHTFLGIKFNY